MDDLRLLRCRDHDLRLRRHLYRRRGADRRLPQRYRNRRGPRRCARPARFTPSSCPTCELLPRLRRLCRAIIDRRCSASVGAARSRAVPLVGLCRAPHGRGRGLAGRAAARGQDRPDRRHQFRHPQPLALRRSRHAAGVACSCNIRCSISGRRKAWSTLPQSAFICSATAPWPAAFSATAGSAQPSRSRRREPLADQVQADHRRLRRLEPVPGAAAHAAPHRRPAWYRHRHRRQRAMLDRPRSRPSSSARDARISPRTRHHRRAAQTPDQGGDRRRAGAAAGPTATSTRSSATAPAATADHEIQPEQAA